jgi:hypothetical protein
MPAVSSYEQLDKRVKDKRSPCPAEERVESWSGVPDAYEPGAHGGSEGETVGEDGITRIKCGGGHLVRRKKLP